MIPAILAAAYMKRVIQLVALFAAALVTAQPLLAYASCAQQQCSGNTCVPACCTGMTAGATGLSSMPSLAMESGCQTLQSMAPADPECGQIGDSVVFAKDVVRVTPHSSLKVGGLALFNRVAPPSEQARPDRAGQWQGIANLYAPDRNILFQVFRI